MRKPILTVAAFIMIAMASCQKSNSNATYTCSCNYILVTGSYSRDTIVATTFPSGTTLTDAQNDCNDEQNALLSSGKKPVTCTLSK